jgi:putative FmdB family regulatory protein
MPTYEYACSSCGHEWEFEQSIKDAPLTECPSCKQPAAKRQISRGTGFILKGSGWGSDLYSSSSNKKPESTKAKSESAGSSEGSGSSGSSDTSSGSTGGDTGSAAKSEGGAAKSEGGAAKSPPPSAAA